VALGMLWGSQAMSLNVSLCPQLVALGISWDQQRVNVSRNAVNFLFIFSHLLMLNSLPADTVLTSDSPLFYRVILKFYRTIKMSFPDLRQ
jgi:hypothetical protein